MNGAERPVGDDDLSAMVDGRLLPERRVAVEAYLAAQPELAGQVGADRALRSALRGRLAAKADEPIPARLRSAAILAERRRRLRSRTIWSAAAALLVGIGFSAGWFARDLPGRPGAPPVRVADVAEEALAAHRTFSVEVVHPVEVKADQEAHLQQWLSKRLGRKLVIPDLESSGLRLIGGRLLPAGREVAAQLMYAGEGGVRATLYVRSGEPGNAQPRLVKEGELASVAWAEAGYGYALSAPFDPDRLMVAARAAQSEVDDGAPRSGNR